MQSDIVILGLSITSSWGNGHATCYRGLVRALTERGHRVLFLERDVPWYASQRDLPNPPHGTTELYSDLTHLQDEHAAAVRDADLVIVGSYVPQGVEVGEWVARTAAGVTAFYDIDTPVTLAKLDRGDYEYLNPALIPEFQLYLSFTGGPILQRLEGEFGSPCARPFYCSVDPTLYYPEEAEPLYDLGYMGTYSADRQPSLNEFLIEPARRRPHCRFAVAGPQFPAEIAWPENVARIGHLPPGEHRHFYNSQKTTLNVTRGDMVRAGFSPSVRLFEAAACGTPILSDWWSGLDRLFEPGREILIARSTADVLSLFDSVSEEELFEIGRRARARVLAEHTCERRACELERHLNDAVGRRGMAARS